MAKPEHPSIDDIVENFSFLDDWDDRYSYLIELGKDLEALPESEHNAANKVQGCTSQVWLWVKEVTDSDTAGDPVIHFLGDSDAHIVRGLVAITLALYNGLKASEIINKDAFAVFSEIGLQEHLTPQRSNGLRSMIERINREAEKRLEA